MLGLLGVSIVWSGVSELAGGPWPGAGRWANALIPVWASAGVLAALATRLPVQNVLAGGLAVFFSVWMVMAVTARLAILPARCEFTRELGPRLLDLVAWPVPFLWLAVVLSARQCARLILRPWRRMRVYGWWLQGVSLATGLVLALVIEPFGHRVLGWWKWLLGGRSGTWWGAPAAFPAAVAVLLAGLLLVAAPWLISKRPTGQTPDYGPLWIWLGLDVWAVAGLLHAGHWMPALIGVVGGAGLAVLAWRGGRATFTAVSPPGVLTALSA